MNPSLSIIIPTIGRPSLKGTLASIYGQLDICDEVLVIGDGPQPKALQEAAFHGFQYFETSPTRLWGHAQRNIGMAFAKKSYLAFIDDDDTYLLKALSSIRKAILESPGKPFLFRVEDGSRVIWEDMTVRFSNVSTQMFIVPNDKKKLGVWQKNAYTPDGRGGDYRFICDTLALYAPSDLVFRPEIIARIPHHSDGR